VEKDLEARKDEIAAAKHAEELRAAQEAIDAKEKLVKEEEKKGREEAKNAIKKEKKTIRRMLRDNNNFLSEGSEAGLVVTQLEKLEYILEFCNIQQLETFRVKLDKAMIGGVELLLLIFDEEHLLIQELQKGNAVPTNGATQSAWNVAETAVLVKSLALFPGGCVARWENILEYVKENSPVKTRTAVDCLAKAKLILATSPNKKVAVSEASRIVTANGTATNGASISKTTNKPDSSANGARVPKMKCPEVSDWTVKEQLQLEDGMAKFSAAMFSGNPGERWVKIAGEVQSKSLKQVKARKKALEDLMKKK
jgi:DnaJ family protein C protein 2